MAIVVEGPGSEALATAVGTHVEAPNSLRDAQTLKAALAARGARTLAPAVGNKVRDVQLVTRAHSAAVQANVDVAILVSLRKSRGVGQAHVWVVEAHGEGAWLDKDVPLEGAKSTESQGDAIWSAASGVFPPKPPAAATEIKETPPSPPEPPSPAQNQATASGAPTAVDTAATLSPGTDGEGGPRANALVVVQANMSGGSRHFTYSERVSAQLRQYDLFVAPVASVGLEIYPLARMRIPVLRSLGLTGGGFFAFELASADAGGTEVKTSWSGYDVGLRERIELTPGALLGIDVGYGANDFKFSQAALPTAELPSVGYQFLRMGGDLRGIIGDISIFGGGAYLYGLSAGAMDHLFPHAQFAGVEGHLGVAHAIGPAFEISVAIDYTRFFYTFHSAPADANIAGGAVDEMAQLSLGLAYLL